MTKRKGNVELIGKIQPDQSYRTTLSPAIFNLGPQATRDKIKNGELPRPFPLSPSSRFEAWTGQQILDHRARMQVLAEEKAAAERAAEKQPQPKALAQAAAKIRKIKLKPPVDKARRQRQRESA
jgi:hypothetical protein